MSNQIQNKPTAAFILSLLGGIIGLLVGLALLALGALTYSLLGEYAEYAGYYGYEATGAFGWTYGTLLGLGIWSLVTSILVIVFAMKLKSNPIEHKKWGALILVFSIIGVGGLLGLIGGILALVYKPILVGAAPQYMPQQQYYGPPPQQAAYQPPQMLVCQQCGTQMQNNVRFCPNCGRQQY